LNIFAKKKTMKKIAFLILTTLLVISCSKYGEGAFTINGTAKGFKDGTKIYLRQFNEVGMIVKSIDSGFIVNQKFDLKGKIDETCFVSITAENEEGNATLLLEKGDLKVELTKGALNASKVTGSYNNEVYTKYNTDFGKLRATVTDKLIAYEGKYREELTTAYKNADSATIKKLRSGYEKINNELVDYSLDFIKKNPKAYLSVLILESNLNNPQMKFDQIKQSFLAIDPELKKVKPGIKIQEKIDAISNTEIGKIAPNFTGKDPKGKEVSLNDLKGKKVTIIDFWASWCAPCRIENKNMVKLNKEFKAKGLSIVGVSLDATDIEWRAAIYSDELNWNHVSNLKSWQDPIALSYNVVGIPCTFILDAEGKIVAKNLKGEELRRKIAELTK
jgi:peroxiredoxin